MRLPSPTDVRRALRRRGQRDDGFALVTTVLAMAVLAAFSLVVLQQTVTNTGAARKDQDWVAALSAAQAGLDDYISRLNDTNGGYYQYTTTNPDTGNPAMGFTSSGEPKWAAVPLADTTHAARGWFHYDVDNTTYTGTSTTPPNGNLVVESTGRVGERTRTLRASVRRSGFVDYVYLTDLETPDPLTYSTPSAVSTALANCTVPWSTPRSGPPTCTDTMFSGDKLTGPVHSNDTMLICDGNQFLDAVTTASPKVASNGDKYFRVDAKDNTGTPVACGTAGTTTYQRPGDPRQVKRISLPSTNLALKRETSAAASPRGCLFVGPTKITIKGAQLKVKSPWTKSPTPGCPVDESWFSIPANGVVYVDVVPSSNSGDPNAPAAGATCTAGSNGVGFPITVSGLTETDWTYPCKAGDVFISQETDTYPLDGRLTVSASNNVYVTGHLDYAGGTTGGSFLGLIAEQFLWFWHPVHKSSTGTVTNLQPLTDLRVSAAMVSLNHAIAVQNHRMGGAMGTLKVNGAFTQKFRGSVGTSSNGSMVSGYAKDYRYDQRLRYDAPPRFLNPLISSFGAVRTAETAPAYR